MRPDQAPIATSDIARMGADVLPVVRLLARWADERPALFDVTLFGDRVRAGQGTTGGTKARLMLAVRYDEARLTDGFDDWIEQLRTGFSDLSAALREPVDVVPPTDGETWRLIGEGEEIAAARSGKVRVVLTPTGQARTVGLPGNNGARTDRPRAVWKRLADGLAVPVSAALAVGRRFTF